MTPTQQAAWDAAVALYKAQMHMQGMEERALSPRADARDLAAVTEARIAHSRAALAFVYAMEDHERAERQTRRAA